METLPINTRSEKLHLRSPQSIKKKNISETLSKQGGSATCHKGQQPFACVLPRAQKKVLVFSTLCEYHTTCKLHAQT